MHVGLVELVGEERRKLVSAHFVRSLLHFFTSSSSDSLRFGMMWLCHIFAHTYMSESCLESSFQNEKCKLLEITMQASQGFCDSGSRISVWRACSASNKPSLCRPFVYPSAKLSCSERDVCLSYFSLQIQKPCSFRVKILS